MIDLAEYEVIVMASDGILEKDEKMSDKQGAEWVKESWDNEKSAEEMSAELVRLARESGSGDDITVMVVKLGDRK